MAQGIHRRDVQEVGHQGVGRRASPLAADTLRTSEAHDVPDDQEVAGQPGAFDDRQLVIELGPGLCCDGVELAAQPLLAEFTEIAPDDMPLGHGESGQPLHREVQADVAALGDPQGIAQGIGPIGEEDSHLLGRLEEPLRVGVQQSPGQRFRERAALADAGQDVVQPLADPFGVVHVVGGHDGHAQPAGQGRKLCRQPTVGGQAVTLQFDPEAVGAEDLPQTASRGVSCFLVLGQQRRGHGPLATAGETEQAVRMFRQCLRRQPGLSLLSRQLPPADQPAKVAVARLCLRQQRQMATTVQRDLGPDDGLDPPLPGRPPEAHRPVQPVVIGERQRRVAQRGRPLHQCLRRRGPVEEGEGAVAVQFDVLRSSHGHRSQDAGGRMQDARSKMHACFLASCVLPLVSSLNRTAGPGTSRP